MFRTWFAFGFAALLAGAATAQDMLTVPAESPAPAASDRTTMYVIDMKIFEGQALLYEEDRGGEEWVDVHKIFGVTPAASDLFLQPPPAQATQPVPAPPEDVEDLRADAVPAPPSRDLHQATKADGPDLWDDAHQPPPGIKLLGAPKVALVPERPATIHFGTEQVFTYLQPLGNGKFERKRTARKELGLTISLAVQPAEGDDRFVDVSPLEIQVSALDGREPVVGLEDLEVGEPIITKRSLTTTARMRLGDTRVIPIPSGPKTEAILVLRVKRFDPEAQE